MMNSRRIFTAALVMSFAALITGKAVASPIDANWSSNEQEIQRAINELTNLDSNASTQFSSKSGNQQAVLREELSSENAAGTNNALIANAGSTNNTVSGRLVQVRSSDLLGFYNQSPQGPAGPSGDSKLGFGVWAQGINADINQNDRNDYNGYHFDSQTAVFGIDKTFGNWAAGISFACSDTDVEADTIDYTTDIDTFQIGVYGSYFSDAYYINGGMAIGFSEVESFRNLSAFGFTAQSETDAESYTYFLDAGYVFKINKLSLTPTLGMTYTYAQTDEYKETGAGLWNQEIMEYDTDSFLGKVGVKANYMLTNKLLGELRATYTHEFIDSETKIKSRFRTAGSNWREAVGLKPDLDSIILGAGLVGGITDDIAAFLNYDLELKDDFVGHTAILGLRYSF
ncbi:MAG: autotransporter outer membrane beta-barrel domain-containing protein [Planctomycetota bacterium]